MPKRIERTGSTDLTDPELLILDKVAMLGGMRSMYYNDIFPNQFNYPEHGLDDELLITTLDRLESDGIITGKLTANRDGKRDRTICVTEYGGSVWESERKPDWTRYVKDIHGPSRSDSGRHRVSIFGHSGQICHAFFDAGVQSGLLDYRGGRISTAFGNRALIYWRPIETVFMLSAWVESWHVATDWKHFEMKRCWWRSANEIGKLWGWSPSQIDA